MAYHYIMERSEEKMTPQELQERTSSPIANKDELLAYMRSFPLVAFTSQPVVDVFTKQEQPDLIDNAMSDGVFTWYMSDIYHLEKYNFRFDDAFMQHVLSKTN